MGAMRYESKAQPSSDAFQQNRTDMLALVARLRALEARAREISSRRKPTFDARGQLPPQARLTRLLDPGLPFLRLHSLANYLVEDDDPETSVPGANLIAGIGFVSGVRCLVWVDDSGIKAGSITRSTSVTGLSLQEIALRQKLPLVHLVESAGADLENFLVESWIDAGRMFRNLARLSAAGVPTIALLHGPSTAGGAYMPGMSDYVIGVKKNGLAALAGAALVRAATGEVVDERELGGSEMHASATGLVEYLAEDDSEAIAMAREAVARLDWNASAQAPRRQPYSEPRYPAEELAGVVPVNYRTPYDVRELLCRILDDSAFDEFKPRYGASTVCAQARILGFACGLIGNNGPIDPQGATKAAHFFQLCDQADIPLIFLHNTTGYMVGTESEQAGMIKHGSKMIQAVTNVGVPRIALHLGASYGAGNYGMCGWAYEPDFLFAWPNASTHVMGAEQAARTMTQVAEVAAERRGKAPDKAAIKAQEERIISHFKRQESAFYSSGRVLDHGVIDPRDTRRVLGFVLETCLEARGRRLRPNSFGVARM